MVEKVVHEHKSFSGIDYAEKTLRDREFVNCEFVNCAFDKSDLKGNLFEDCTFISCNFSLAHIEQAGFSNVVFIGCKMLGVDFTKCSSFAFSFSCTDCNLDYSNFFGKKLRKTIFKNCTLKEVDFTEADLTASEFLECDLSLAKFSNTNLEQVNFRSAINFVIDPERNKMKKAKFSAQNLEGLLAKYNLDIE